MWLRQSKLKLWGLMQFSRSDLAKSVLVVCCNRWKLKVAIQPSARALLMSGVRHCTLGHPNCCLWNATDTTQWQASARPIFYFNFLILFFNFSVSFQFSCANFLVLDMQLKAKLIKYNENGTNFFSHLLNWKMKHPQKTITIQKKFIRYHEN